MKEQQVTICAKCLWLVREERGTPREDVWYNWFCGHPSVERKLVVDPVTGKKAYACRNSLGDPYHNDQKHPYCRDINDGYCELYEE